MWVGIDVYDPPGRCVIMCKANGAGYYELIRRLADLGFSPMGWSEPGFKLGSNPRPGVYSNTGTIVVVKTLLDMNKYLANLENKADV